MHIASHYPHIAHPYDERHPLFDRLVFNKNRTLSRVQLTLNTVSTEVCEMLIKIERTLFFNYFPVAQIGVRLTMDCKMFFI